MFLYNFEFIREDVKIIHELNIEIAMSWILIIIIIIGQSCALTRYYGSGVIILQL